MELNTGSKEESEKQEDQDTKEEKAEPKKSGKFPKFLKRHKKLWIFLIIVAILAIVTVKIIIPRYFSSKNQQVTSTQTFESIQKMDLSNTIAVTGTVAAKESRSVSTLVSDTKVLTVSVSVGDYVQAGDPICTFETTGIQDKIDNLEKQMNINEAKAEINVNQANTTLANDLTDNLTTVSRNQETYNDALKDYYNSCDGYNAAKQAKSDADTALQNALNDYNAAKEKYDALPDAYKAGTTTASANSSEYIIIKNYTYYQGLYNTAKSNDDSAASKVSSYESSIENAQSALEKADQSLDDSTTTAGRTYTKDNVNVYSTGLDASATNDSNEEQLEDYKEQLADCNVVAPISGLITSVSVEVGDEYTEKSEICVIQDDTGYIIEGTVDQYDISSISENQAAVIKTDATGDDELEGTVTFVSPVPESSSTSSATSTTTGSSGASSGSSTSSSTDYPIEITLAKRDDRLRIGMTAETSVITEQVKDVLAVPYDCVQTDSDGNSVIYVADETASAAASSSGNSADAGNNQPAERPTEMSTEEMPAAGASGEMPSGSSGKMPAAGMSGNMPSGMKSGSNGKTSGGTGDTGNTGNTTGTASTGDKATKAIKVTTGLETDYYTEVQSDEISEGMQVLVPNSISTSSASSTSASQTDDSKSSGSLFGMGGGGGQQGGGGAPGGGGGQGGPGGGF